MRPIESRSTSGEILRELIEDFEEFEISTNGWTNRPDHKITVAGKDEELVTVPTRVEPREPNTRILEVDGKPVTAIDANAIRAEGKTNFKTRAIPVPRR